MRRFQVSISVAALLIGLTAAALLPSRTTEAAAFDIPSGDVAGLIAAINAANANPDADTINLAPIGTYTLAAVDNTVDAAGFCSAPNGLPAITSQITINGYGATIRRSSAAGTPSFRIFCIAGPHTGNLTLNGVTVSGGNSTAAGAGIYNLQGIVTVTDSTITNNYAQSGGGGIANEGGTAAVSRSTIRDNTSFYWGGGIFNLGATLTLTESTVSSNRSGGYRGGGVVNLAGYATLTGSTVSVNTSTGQGAGGLLNWAGVLTLTNSTVSGNTGNGYAGAISNTSGAQLTLANSTVFGNRDIGGAAGGIHSDSGIVTLKNMIVANDSASDCAGAMTVVGHNLLRSPVGACTIVGSGMVIGGDPLLGPLANNGGPTLTHAPLLGSPVIDAVPLADCTDASGAPLTVDQRAIARPQGAACDIGAVELSAVPTTTSVSFGAGPFPYTGTVYSATATVSPAGSGAAAITYSGDCTNAGTCTATATYPGDINHQPSTSTASITITPAVTTITITGGGTYEYDGAAHPLTARVTGAGGLDQPVTVGGCIATPTVPSDSCVGEAIFAGGGNYLASSSSATVTIVDTTPPTLTLPAPLTLEAPGPLGAVVTFTTTAVDLLDPDPAVACTPVSGSTFPLGTTTVTCTARDAAGNTGSASFSVTVQDTTPPVLTLPTSIFAEATSAAGAVVTFTVTATDLIDGPLPVTCAPASGATFALGSTTVACTAADAAGNTGSASFSVTVQDTTPPVLTLPTNISADATEPSGAVVTFTVPATDVADPSPTAVCTPVSGLMFAIGTTTVSCTATDAAGNTTTGTFSVHVNSGSEQVQALAAAVTGVGSGTSLLAKVQTLQAQIAAGNTTAACNSIKALLNEVSAQAGKKLTAAQAATITGDANRIAAVLGC